MLKPQGYAVLYDADGTIAEMDSFSCGHCNRIVHVRPKADPAEVGGLCKCCMRLICPHCLDTGTCDPIERKLERQEARYHALRSYEENA
jgi:hypothetical protein